MLKFEMYLGAFAVASTNLRCGLSEHVQIERTAYCKSKQLVAAQI